MKVLLADDDPVITAAIGGALVHSGWVVQTVHDAMQAVMYASRAPHPDVIVLDLNMPAGTGFHALQRLKASSRTAHIPVVVLTGRDDAGLADRVRELGAETLVHKPVSPGEFAGFLSALVAGAVSV